jgi:hypothetical protein
MLINSISAKEFIKINFPKIRVPSTGFKIFLNNPGKELTIKEVIKNDLVILPLGYIRKIIGQINDDIDKKK